MKVVTKVAITIISLPLLLIALYIGYLWATYIDETINSGSKYGFTLGHSKKDSFDKISDLLEKYPKTKIYISYGQRAGDRFTLAPTASAYIKIKEYETWSLLLDGDGEFFNTIRLRFRGDNLSEIHRHRKYFEAP